MSHAPISTGGARRGNAVVHVLLVVAAAYFAVPILWLIFAATKDNTDLFRGGFGPSGHFALFDNIGQLFSYQGGIFWRWLANSAFYSIGGSVLATLFAAAAGYVFAKFQFRGKTIAFNLVLASVMVPASALALPLYLLFSQVQLTNTVWSVLLPSCLSPFGVYLARVYTSSAVPDELIESARLDGASEPRIFFGIVTPLIGPGLVTVFLFQFVAIWNNFFLPFVMLSSLKNYTVTLGLQALSVTPPSQGVAYYNLILTGSLISVIPLAAAFLILQRWWRTGLSLGSVTG